jgi:hypothetical protein
MNTKKYSNKLISGTCFTLIFLSLISCIKVAGILNEQAAHDQARAVEPTTHETTESIAKHKKYSDEQSFERVRSENSRRERRAIEGILKLARECDGKCHD